MGLSPGVGDHKEEMHPNRNRVLYGLITTGVVVTGLLSRSSVAEKWPRLLSVYAGDTLWAATVFLALAIALPSKKTSHLAVAAIVIAFTVEASQLYQAHWFGQIRNTVLGRLLLGAGFMWSDLLCYTAGVLIAATADTLATNSTAKKSPTSPCSLPAGPRGRDPAGG